MKIYLVCLESNLDGEVFFDVVPCKTIERAREIIREERNTTLEESYPFSNYTLEELKNNDDFDVIDEDDRFYVNGSFTGYWEDYYIKEKEIV